LIGYVRRGGFSTHRRIGGNDDLLNAVFCDSAMQLIERQVFWVDAFERAQGAAEHVIQAPKLRNALDEKHVGRLLNDAYARCVATRITAQRAPWCLGKPKATITSNDPLPRHVERACKLLGLLRIRTNEMHCETLRSTPANSW
jgi:hypothetical protein